MIGSGNYGNLKNSDGSQGKELLNARTTSETDAILRQIEEVQSLSGIIGCPPKKHDITNNFPKWIRSRKSDSDSNFITFLQSYYDWLYCKGSSGSQYYVESSDFLNLLNLQNNIPLQVVKSFASSYAADFPQGKIGNEGGSQGVTKENFIRFLTDIKDSFYETKGSEFSFKYFFNSLYGKTLESNDLDYPKKKIIRLNGGRYYDLPSRTSSGGTGSYEEISSLGGAYLGNNYVLQDNYFYQEFSYLVKVGLDSSYSEILLDVLHPMGLQPFFEQTFDDYVPIGGDGVFTEGIAENVEQTRLGNYLPYRIDATGDLQPCVGCSGSLLGVQYFNTVGSTGQTYDIVTYNHPGWALAGATTETIGDIDKYDLSFSGVTIGEFLNLVEPGGIENPNEGITTCDNQTCLM